LPASAGLTLSFDSSLYDPGVSISNVQFGPLTDLSAAMAAAASAATSATNAQNSADSALVALSSIASDNVLSAGEKPAVILDYTVLSGEQSGIDTQATTYSISTEKVAYDASVSALTAYLNSLVTPTAWNNLAGDTTINGPNFRSVFSSVYSSRQALLNAIAIAAKNRLGALATLNTVGTSIIEPNAATDVYTATASNVTITGVRGTPNTIGKFTSLASVTFTAQVTGDVLFQAEAPCVVTTSTSYPYASLNSVIAMNSVVTGPSSTYASNANIGYSQTLNVTIFRTRRLSVVAGTAYTIELLAQGNDASVSLVATDVQIRVEVIKR
jgi:hypothetical protein